MIERPPFRAMSVGDLLDTTFRLYRAHFVTFIGIAALVQVPMAIIQFMIQFVAGGDALAEILRFSARPPRVVPGQSFFEVFPVNAYITFYILSLALGGLQFLVRQGLIAGALAKAIAGSYLHQEMSALDAYRLGGRRYGALLAVATLMLAMFVTFSVTLVTLPAGVIFAILVRPANGGSMAGILLIVLLALIGALGVLLVTLLVYTRFLFSMQAIVLEDRGPLDSLRRSWRLTQGSFWRVVGILILMAILTYLISSLPATMLSFLFSIIYRGAVQQLLWSQAITVLVAQIGSILALPLQFGLYTLLYYDLRVRKEGYDIELMAQRLAAT